MRRVALFLIMLAPGFCQAWYDSGHMASSWIAWQQMTPHARQQTQKLLDVFKDIEPATDNFVIASTWMDAIKDGGMKSTRYWHTISEHQVKYGLLTGPEGQNGVQQANESIKVLKDENSVLFAKAFHIRSLLHVIQDLHSPLQICNDSLSKPPEAKKCYQGFTFSAVPWHGEMIKNLAALWDTGVLAFPAVRHYDPNATAVVAEYSRQLLEKHPLSTLPDQTSIDPLSWAQESLKLQKGFALRGIKSGGSLSEEYISQGKVLAEQRVVIAGYRMAYLLNQIFQSGAAKAAP